MAFVAKGRSWTAVAVIAVGMMTGAGIAEAAQCGNNAAGYNAWLQQTMKEAASRGIGKAGINALANTKYAQATIRADRSQKSFKLSFEQFMQKRGADTIIKRGRAMKQQNAALFANIEKRYGVPAGPLIAIWGMETGFGAYMGKQHTLSAVATLAYDCRRSDYFTDQLYAALKLIDREDLSPAAIGAMHGEIGQTQFLPVNVLNYGVDETAAAISTWRVPRRTHSIPPPTSSSAMAGSAGPAISRVNPTMPPFRAGMPHRFTSAPSPSWARPSTANDCMEYKKARLRPGFLVHSQYFYQSSGRLKSPVW